jgi:hypothetical protein
MPGLSDYAVKTWGGLERQYHMARYQLFIDEAVVALNTSVHSPTPFNSTKFAEGYFRKFLDFAIDWDNEEWDPATLPTTTVGDPVEISMKLLAKYKPM